MLVPPTDVISPFPNTSRCKTPSFNNSSAASVSSNANDDIEHAANTRVLELATFAKLSLAPEVANVTQEADETTIYTAEMRPIPFPP